MEERDELFWLKKAELNSVKNLSDPTTSMGAETRVADGVTLKLRSTAKV